MFLNPAIWDLSDVDFGDFDQPFADAEQLTTFLAHPENDTIQFETLRTYAAALAINSDESPIDWPALFIHFGRSKPDLAYVARSADQLRAAVLIMAARGWY